MYAQHTKYGVFAFFRFIISKTVRLHGSVLGITCAFHFSLEVFKMSFTLINSYDFWDVHRNACRSSCKPSPIAVQFEQRLECADKLQQNSLIANFMEINSMVTGFLYVTVRHSETNRCIFATFCCNCTTKGSKYKNISEVLYVTVRHSETNRCIFATFCWNCTKKGSK